MRRSGPPSTRSRYQSPATRPGLRTAFMSPPSVTGFPGFPDDTPNAAEKVSAAVAIDFGEPRSSYLRQPKTDQIGRASCRERQKIQMGEKTIKRKHEIRMNG